MDNFDCFEEPDYWYNVQFILPESEKKKILTAQIW